MILFTETRASRYVSAMETKVWARPFVSTDTVGKSIGKDIRASS